MQLSIFVPSTADRFDIRVLQNLWLRSYISLCPCSLVNIFNKATVLGISGIKLILQYLQYLLLPLCIKLISNYTLDKSENSGIFV